MKIEAQQIQSFEGTNKIFKENEPYESSTTL